MINNRSVLLISAIALILLALVPAVSASEVIYDRDLYEYIDTSKSGLQQQGGFTKWEPNNAASYVVFKDITEAQTLNYLIIEIPKDTGYWPDRTKIEEGRHDFTYHFNGADRPGVLYVNRKTNLLGQVTATQFTIFLNEWDIGDLIGQQSIELPFYFDYGNMPAGSMAPTTNVYIAHVRPIYPGTYLPTGDYPIKITESTGITWKHHIKVEEGSTSYYVNINGFLDGHRYTSQVNLWKDGEIYATFTNPGNDLFRAYLKTEINLLEIISPLGTEYAYPLYEGDTPADPDDPGETSTLRTGSVTMTDHNGTSISGFEVTAVNHYTGEEYTVSTDTDVAVISLPMDRTVEIRNPQTGVYEEAPIGYYRFYGQKPGYKMLNEEGIKVSVMPEKYGSYKLCDILVSSDTGPLTGKHKFQLRSWSDNSILQTGTLSAKSRTTGIWYNTTVTNGIATLILPYDTSDALSEYAGHYYVYATSPGYEDIDYGVQIAVYPRTVSEVRTIHLYPIGGVPTPGNVTLRIQAISETGQSVPNAEIFIAGVLGAGKDVWDTYTTSWTGFIEVSVPGNSTYDIVARAAGYYDSSRRIEVFTEDPPIIEMRLYLSGAPTVEPTTEPTGWVTGPPTIQPTGGIPDEDDDSDGFIMQAVRGIANLFGVSFGIGKTILGMLLALGIGTATAKQLRGGAQEFGMGMLGGVVLGVLIGLLPIWVLVLLVLIVGLWIGQRYMSGGDS